MRRARSNPRRSLRDCLALFALVGGVGASGCATFFSGTHDTLDFDANVPGVRLSIDGRPQGELPLSVDVSRSFIGGQQFRARFEKDGFQTQEFTLTRELNPVAILDLTSVVTSGGVDLLTGALMKFSPTDYYVEMRPSGVRAGDLERSLQAKRFGLVNCEHLKTELARGGGEYLSAFAALVADGDEAAERSIIEDALNAAPALVGSGRAPRFIERFAELLAGDPALQRYHL